MSQNGPQNKKDTTGQNLTGTGQRSVGGTWGRSPAVEALDDARKVNALPPEERTRAAAAFVRNRLGGSDTEWAMEIIVACEGRVDLDAVEAVVDLLDLYARQRGAIY